jgi:hypothetical protein
MQVPYNTVIYQSTDSTNTQLLQNYMTDVNYLNTDFLESIPSIYYELKVKWCETFHFTTVNISEPYSNNKQE